MVTLTKPLLALTANDLMSTPVTMIPREMSIESAARLLRRADVSGAPVVDDYGRCIGVVSAGDFVAWAAEPDRPDWHPHGNPGCAHAAWQMMEIDDLPKGEVQQLMTGDPVTASPNTSIGDLARQMVDAHIHRVVVVDKENRPKGIVSTTDILVAIARAAQRAPESAERRHAFSESTMFG
jgi:tRNA nucleotidyltransferase (CCA-adding enzyme)